MLTRFELLVVLRQQLRERALVQRSLAFEAVMETLAEMCGGDAQLWGLAGLGADIDVKLTQDNPARRGAIAEELLRTEGAPAAVAVAVRLRHDTPADRQPQLARGLVVAEALVDHAWRSASFDDVSAAALQSCVEHTPALRLLGLDPGVLAERVRTAWLAMREELGR